MTNNRLVIVSYVVFALLAGIFLEHILLAGFSIFSATQPLTTTMFQLPLGPGEPKDFSWATIIGLAISAALWSWLWVKPETNNVAQEIAAELRKVTWPSLDETRAATVAVIVASIIAAVLLGLFDVFWQFLTDKIQNPTL
jgi:preprotein translocase subunit SecE